MEVKLKWSKVMTEITGGGKCFHIFAVGCKMTVEIYGQVCGPSTPRYQRCWWRWRCTGWRSRSSHLKDWFSPWQTAALQLQPICQPKCTWLPAQLLAHYSFAQCFSALGNISKKKMRSECVFIYVGAGGCFQELRLSSGGGGKNVESACVHRLKDQFICTY